MTQENGGSAGGKAHLRPVPMNVVHAVFQQPADEEDEVREVDPSDPNPYGEWCYVIWATEPCPCQDAKCKQFKVIGVGGDEEESAWIISDYVRTKNSELDERMRAVSADERVVWSRRRLRVIDSGLRAVDLRGDTVVAERRPYGGWNENG